MITAADLLPEKHTPPGADIIIAAVDAARYGDKAHAP
jgi:hypothetical protein